jgi:hypothetical protein
LPAGVEVLLISVILSALHRDEIVVSHCEPLVEGRFESYAHSEIAQERDHSGCPAHVEQALYCQRALGIRRRHITRIQFRKAPMQLIQRRVTVRIFKL